MVNDNNKNFIPIEYFNPKIFIALKAFEFKRRKFFPKISKSFF